TPKDAGKDGVVHHALAFSTLLSSQETDATTITSDSKPSHPLRGVTFASFFLSTILPRRPIRVKPSHFEELDPNRATPEESQPPRLQGNPSTLPDPCPLRERMTRKLIV
ncbi:hypothetical protein ACFY05_14665, partial [Microtetraspora fusca]